VWFGKSSDPPFTPVIHIRMDNVNIIPICGAEAGHRAGFGIPSNHRPMVVERNMQGPQMMFERGLFIPCR
jgi:hypothetical protein